MIFIGGTNHGRRDGGIPALGAQYHRINRIDCAGHRSTFREVYYRQGRYWVHESLDTPEKIAEAIRKYEWTLAEKRPRHERRNAGDQ